MDYMCGTVAPPRPTQTQDATTGRSLSELGSLEVSPAATSAGSCVLASAASASSLQSVRSSSASMPCVRAQYFLSSTGVTQLILSPHSPHTRAAASGRIGAGLCRPPTEISIRFYKFTIESASSAQTIRCVGKSQPGIATDTLRTPAAPRRRRSPPPPAAGSTPPATAGPAMPPAPTAAPPATVRPQRPVNEPPWLQHASEYRPCGHPPRLNH